jgi:hypothetical protein
MNVGDGWWVVVEDKRITIQWVKINLETEVWPSKCRALELELEQLKLTQLKSKNRRSRMCN